jgi:hypothetical protein
MNAEEIIKLKKKALYSSIKSPEIFGKFFNKSILHNAVVMENRLIKKFSKNFRTFDTRVQSFFL